MIARGGGFFGEGFGTVHLDFLNCTGSEEQLMNCDSSGFGKADCFSFEADAGVICPGTCVRPTPAPNQLISSREDKYMYYVHVG